ncbi:ATP-binding cassette domain-containing protein [Actinomadura atramentaria]|uniref:ATP-binding cassette domain-containing protein n=1 Tax=Actinomadura atramentaria TaxID=1990 RepID=UPI00036A9F05|nr:ATP-binding cassette domain-containing protein [Actinomadura atramentaria]
MTHEPRTPFPYTEPGVATLRSGSLVAAAAPGPPEPAVLRATGLRKTYDPAAGPVLDGIDAAFRGGELCALTGPSGAGKSTLLACLAGHEPPSGGGVRLVDGPGPGTPVRGPCRTLVGYAPAHARPFPRRTVAAFARWTAALARVPFDPHHLARIAWLLGLGDALDTRAADLPPRDARLALCAAALLPRPRLLAVDAAPAGPGGADAAFLDRLRRAAGGLGTGVVAVAADAAAAAVADRVVALADGRLTESGAADGADDAAEAG